MTTKRTPSRSEFIWANACRYEDREGAPSRPRHVCEQMAGREWDRKHAKHYREESVTAVRVVAFVFGDGWSAYAIADRRDDSINDVRAYVLVGLGQTDDLQRGLAWYRSRIEKNRADTTGIVVLGQPPHNGALREMWRAETVCEMLGVKSVIVDDAGIYKRRRSATIADGHRQRSALECLRAYAKSSGVRLIDDKVRK